MSTNISNTTSFCTPTQALDYHDARQWGDVALDTNTRESQANLLTDPRFQNLLNDAAGMIEMACLRGNRYLPADLSTNLTGVSKQMLVGLNAELAFWKGVTRRHPDKPLSPTSILALQTLDQLASGEKIFSFQETADAGNPFDQFLQAQDLLKLGLASDAACRFFGQRSKWTRLYGGGRGCGC